MGLENSIPHGAAVRWVNDEVLYEAGEFKVSFTDYVIGVAVITCGANSWNVLPVVENKSLKADIPFLDNDGNTVKDGVTAC